MRVQPSLSHEKTMHVWRGGSDRYVVSYLDRPSSKFHTPAKFDRGGVKICRQVDHASRLP